MGDARWCRHGRELEWKSVASIIRCEIPASKAFILRSSGADFSAQSVAPLSLREPSFMSSRAVLVTLDILYQAHGENVEHKSVGKIWFDLSAS